MKASLIILFILFLVPHEGMACECVRPHDFSKKRDLKRYAFIAFVEIDSIYTSAIEKINEHDIFYEARFDIIELFKGRPRTSILVSGANAHLNNGWTSCDIGIDAGEQWVVFAYKDRAGKLRTGRCTFTKMYANKLGEKDWQLERGIKELRQLRHLYKHKEPEVEYAEGRNITYYPNGQIEIEQYYKNGLANGSKLIYYNDGTLMVEEFYKVGKRSGHSRWFDRKGGLLRDYTFENGHPVDTCYYYWAFQGGVSHERIFDQDGNMLRNIHYDINGVLRNTTEIDYRNDKYKTTAYYDSGNIKSITLRHNSTHGQIRTTEYFEFGAKKREWIYFPEDRRRRHKYSEYLYNGDLHRSYILMKDGSRTYLKY